MFTFGFYNSLNGDRKYDATQMASIFDGIIEDGIYGNILEKFMTAPGTGLQVIVKTGRAWFKHTWNLNDAWLPIDLAPADPLRSRIDSVVIEINSNLDIRENSIKVIQGEVAVSPIAPSMVHEGGIDQYRLANIKIGPSATSISEEDITITVGRDETPFVTCPLTSIDISELFNQWNGQFQSFMEHIEEQLEGDVVTNLQKQIDGRVKIADKATEEDIKNAVPDKWIDAKMAKENLFGITNGLKIGDIVYSTRDLEAETDGKFLKCDQRIIDKSDYQELCNTTLMQNRLDDIKFGRLYSDIKPNNYYIDSNYFVNGCIHDGYIYQLYIYSNNIIIRRTKLGLKSSSSWETVFNTTTSGSYNCFIYIDYLYLYIIPTIINPSNPSSSNIMYKVLLDDFTYSSFSLDTISAPEGMSSSNISVNAQGYLKTNEYIYIIGHYSNRYYLIIQYSMDFQTRVYKWTDQGSSDSSVLSQLCINTYDHEIRTDKNGTIYLLRIEYNISGYSVNNMTLYKKEKDSLIFEKCNIDIMSDAPSHKYLNVIIATGVRLVTTSNNNNIFLSKRRLSGTSVLGQATAQLIYDLDNHLTQSKLFTNDDDHTYSTAPAYYNTYSMLENDMVLNTASLNNTIIHDHYIYMRIYVCRKNPLAKEGTSYTTFITTDYIIGCFDLNEINATYDHDINQVYYMYEIYGKKDDDPIIVGSTRSSKNGVEDNVGSALTYYKEQGHYYGITASNLYVLPNHTIQPTILRTPYDNSGLTYLTAKSTLVYSNDFYICFYDTFLTILEKQTYRYVLPLIYNCYIKALD